MKKGIAKYFDFQAQGYELGDQIGEGAYGQVFFCKKIGDPE